MRQYIWIRLTVPGFHHWPGAPTYVGFLRESHRHLFHITVWWEVGHGNRAREFFTEQAVVKQMMERYTLMEHGYEFGPRSCEMIAEEIAEALAAAAVSVSEDGENGGLYVREDMDARFLSAP